MPEPETPNKTPTESETSSEAADRDSLLTKATGKSEEAIKRIQSEIDKNERAREVRKTLTDAGRTLLHQLNLSSHDEVEALQKEIEELQQRIAQLEGSAKAPRAGRAADG
jgi:ubiquinone biosynthesis protein UbiJ